MSLREVAARVLQYLSQVKNPTSLLKELIGSHSFLETGIVENSVTIFWYSKFESKEDRRVYKKSRLVRHIFSGSSSSNVSHTQYLHCSSTAQRPLL